MKRPPSIRRTLLIRCGFGVGVCLCLLAAGTYLTVRRALFRELDHTIKQTAALLSNQLELENGRVTFEWQEGIGTNRALPNNALFQFWDETTGVITRSPALKERELPHFHRDDGVPVMRDIELPATHYHARAVGLRVYPCVLPEEMRRMTEEGRIIDPKTLPQILVVARDTTFEHRLLNRLAWILGTGTLLTLGLGFALIHRAVRGALKPIDDLTQQVRDHTGQQLESALETPGELPAELMDLAESYDLLLARVAVVRRRERDFIRHAAHELRTPIAAMQATIELALSQTRDAAAYVGHLATCQKTAAELGELVRRLTALARIGQPGCPATIETIDLEHIMADCRQSYLPVLTARGLTVSHTPASDPARATGDRSLVRIIFNNLLDNAAAHARPGSGITIRWRHDNGRVEVALANPASELPDDPDRLFEPLYRRECSRADDSRHLGIGLTLSQEAATAMGATLHARRTGDGWLEFILGLPAA